jgi:uncharacterized membrane protein
MLDLVLAILHHFFIFALFAVLVGELILVKHGMGVAAWPESTASTGCSPD